MPTFYFINLLKALIFSSIDYDILLHLRRSTYNYENLLFYYRSLQSSDETIKFNNETVVMVNRSNKHVQNMDVFGTLNGNLTIRQSQIIARITKKIDQSYTLNVAQASYKFLQ